MPLCHSCHSTAVVTGSGGGKPSGSLTTFDPEKEGAVVRSGSFPPTHRSDKGRARNGKSAGKAQSKLPLMAVQDANLRTSSNVIAALASASPVPVAAPEAALDPVLAKTELLAVGSFVHFVRPLLKAFLL
ncbi:hypothetical protein EDC04DRAFT_2598164 [Pisolithus marmoratus]|nr:hypothetical protein EDC04DRAFT_2598164 [Pisolithus marmoratus]